MKQLLFLLFILLVLNQQVSACSVQKKQLWNCFLNKGDKDSNGLLSTPEIRKLVVDNTHWWEKLIKSPDSVVKQVKEHCGLPLTYSNLLKKECFKHCGGLDGKRTVYNRICQ